MSQVSKCMCEECTHNHSFECHADSIEVHSMGDMQVQASDGTMCKTFAPRESAQSSMPTRL